MTLEFYFQVLFCKFARIRKNKFSIPLLLDELNIMILFIDEYVTVFRRKHKRFMRSVSSKHPVS